MRLPIICSQCMRDDLASAYPFTSLEWSDDGRYEVECPKGHKSVTILQEQKFELLFDIGAYAIIDGYYREAVSSFTSSLERFYEFFITAVLLHKGLPDDVFKSAWKLVASQSERQLGAFIFTYTSEFQRPPKVLRTKSVEFRNEVIHKGKIPSRAKAAEYGQEVLDVVRPILAETKQKYPEGVRATIHQHTSISRQGDQWAGLVAIPTIISLSRDDQAYQERSLEAALADIKLGRLDRIPGPAAPRAQP